MIIGIDASRANRTHKSGTEWYSYYLIRALAKIDSKNQYLLYSDKPLIGGLLDLTAEDSSIENGDHVRINKHGFQEIRSPHNNFKAKVLKWPYNFLWTQGRLSLEMLFSAPDVLFVPAHTLPLIHPSKSVVTIHDVGFERDNFLYDEDQMGPIGKYGRKMVNCIAKCLTLGKYGANSKDYLRWSTHFALKHASKVITISKFSKSEILDVYGTEGSKVDVVYNGYNCDLYKTGKDTQKISEVSAKYGVEIPYIIYVGRLERKKNTPALIEAFALMKEENRDIKHKLVLVGDASYGYDEVKYAIKYWQLDDEVIMTGWADETDMPHLLSGATAFVFPSLYEGFGIPLLQAMASGVPIVASNKASIPEVVGDAAILFDPLDVRSMADGMKRIITDTKLQEELSRKGQARVKEFGWDKCAEETLKVLESVVA